VDFGHFAGSRWWGRRFRLPNFGLEAATGCAPRVLSDFQVPEVRLGVAKAKSRWHYVGALPDLSNVHFLERGLNWSTLAYIVFVCLAAAASFLLALFAGRVTSAKDAELKRVQSTAAEAAEHAHADVANAQAHCEQLRNQNLELQLAVEKERSARLQLEERLGSRHISAAQRQAIQLALASYSGQKVSIVTHPGDPEIGAFASEIKATLEAAGMAVTLTPALIFGEVHAGIVLDVGVHRREFATALAKAFVDAGVCSGAISASEAEDADLLEITVGPKRP
jgi:hypothetical protein